jgi:hypothetical protein
MMEAGTVLETKELQSILIRLTCRISLSLPAMKTANLISELYLTDH